ncbi:MAG TPA: DNA polymerase III subunit gamma/tau [Candidatus Saccharimonadia bacterium]|nr:DNA polymerase III subunit gamma/tau [Candidatus Saccharimonadia bacterium]
MGQALYRKHRPKSLQEVVGQEHITKTLEKAVEQGRISHAYLFTGPRGVGKTSVARILAHQINGLPYSDDSAHLDIIEIDAASNRRIDEIRELRDKVYVAPTSAKYKVYIIDEVHMLTREAFNALLKTLEEPPAHVVFVLATTDAHKLPETIVSRTQRFSFKPAGDAAVKNLLAQIAKAEKIDVSDESLALIAQHGAGSFRDSVSLLDQAASRGGRVEAGDVEQMLGIPSAEAIENLESLVFGGAAPSELMRVIAGLYGQGYQASAVAKQLGQSIRRQLESGGLPLEPSLELLSKLIEVPASHDPDRALEIALLQATPSPQAAPIVAVAEPPQLSPAEELPELEPEPTEPVKVKPVSAAKPGNLPFGANIWPEALKLLKQRYNTLYGVVRMAEPAFTDNKLKLTFAFGFHQKRLNENSNRQKLVDILHELTGQAIDIESAVDKAATPPKITVETPHKPAAKSDTGNLSAISNIFGSAELLES